MFYLGHGCRAERRSCHITSPFRSRHGGRVGVADLSPKIPGCRRVERQTVDHVSLYGPSLRIGRSETFHRGHSRGRTMCVPS